MRCDHCRYWEDNDDPATWHADDRRGSCRRNAPRPTLGDWEYQVLNQLTHLTAQLCPGLDKKEFWNWEEAHGADASWPTTLGHDWCGEFKAVAKKKSKETNHAKGRLLLEAKPSD